MNFRLAREVAGKTKAGALTATPLDANLLANSSAHPFVVNCRKDLVVSNTCWLKAAAPHGKGRTHVSLCARRALRGILELMQEGGPGRRSAA
jgi:hypothetical protein